MFENLDGMPTAFRDDLVLVSEKEYATFDKDVECHVGSLQTYEDIANDVLQEQLSDEPGSYAQTDPPAKNVEEDDDEVLEVEEVTPLRDMDEVKTILRQLEDYCNRTNGVYTYHVEESLTRFPR